MRVERGLVDLLVRDTEGDRGFPLLSHALVETWRRRDGKVLTVEGYRASGGSAAPSPAPRTALESLPAEATARLRALMLRLVAPSLEGEPVAMPGPDQPGAARGDPPATGVVARLVRARL